MNGWRWGWEERETGSRGQELGIIFKLVKERKGVVTEEEKRTGWVGGLSNGKAHSCIWWFLLRRRCSQKALLQLVEVEEGEKKGTKSDYSTYSFGWPGCCYFNPATLKQICRSVNCVREFNSRWICGALVYPSNHLPGQARGSINCSRDWITTR